MEAVIFAGFMGGVLLPSGFYGRPSGDDHLNPASLDIY